MMPCHAICLAVAALAADPQPADARTIRLPVTRDTWFSAVGSEADCNLGGAEQLKVKSIQELSLVDFDPSPLQGRTIRSATLHVRRRGEERLLRATVGTFAAPWVEGTSPRYEPQQGSSSFNSRQHPDVPWAFAGSDLCDVMLGLGGTLWHSADASPSDADGWQQIPVSPDVIAARSAGISYGCVVFDDTGSEWTRDGERFALRLFPNRFLYSREAGPQRAPYFTVELGEPDDEAPPAPIDLKAEALDLPSGEAWVSWRTPVDIGPSGTIGFFVELDGREVPRYLVPKAGEAVQPVRMHLREMGLRPGAEVELVVRAVDGAGNRGPAARLTFAVSARQAANVPGTPPAQASRKAALPTIGKTEVAVVDALDKALPGGMLIPAHGESYLSSNHLWDAATRHIRMAAARNEFVDFQVLLRGPPDGLSAHFKLADDSRDFTVSIGEPRSVAARGGPTPDPVVPLGNPCDLPAAHEKSSAEAAGLLIEIYVPHNAAVGEHRATLVLSRGRDVLELPIVLTVWDFTLPDFLSFIPEMNCYDLPSDERGYYRLAHEHRTVLNRVPYYQNGTVAEGCAPIWDGRRLDWTAWDRRFGAYFDGSAFADLPRPGVPLECFYLPLHENWPTPMEGNYNGDYWADSAFPPAYRQAFVEITRQTAEHFHARGWHDTLFQGFFNGKNNFKERGWSRGSSPWLLDEPANFQDYWALAWFGRAFHEGIAAADGEARLVFRCDISRPQWQRDVLDPVLDYNVVGGAFRQYRRMVLDRKEACGQVVIEYGSSNAIDASNVQPAAWCIDAWTLGADGVLSWQTVGNESSWREADPLALVYPGAPAGLDRPAASMRLKAYRRGQQDVEYLTWWTRLSGEPRWSVASAVRDALHLAGHRGGTGFTGGEDAGVVQFGNLLPQDLWALRMRIGRAISERHPSAQRRLVEIRPRPRTATVP